MKDVSQGLEPASSPGRLAILARLLGFVVVLALILFLAAGSWIWGRGWIFIAAYTLLAVSGLWLVPLDPGLIEERTRLKDDVKLWDKRLNYVGGLLYPLAILITAGLDHRFRWSPAMAAWLPWLALFTAAAGNLLSTWAAAVNRFYSRFVRIQHERGHHVVADGPYRYLRHPGYLGQIIFSLASGLALGSLWALVPGSLFAGLLILRTALEDRTLQEELAGYQDYSSQVRFRLIPFIW